MLSFLYDLKGQATIGNGIIVLLIASFIFYKYQKRKIAGCLGIISVLVWLLCSTYYLPHHLADKLERIYPPFSLPSNDADTTKVLIHVLGSGYTIDARLPANAQLGLVGLGRLAEAIRIHRSIKNSLIVCSGYSPLGLETQAQVTKRAAIVLGVDEARIETLNNPSTTQQEANELARYYKKTAKLIVVTDAIHMPRAIKLFQAEGFNPIAAPTNFKVNKASNKQSMKWWPSLGNISLINYIIHEYLGNLKYHMSL